MIMKTSTRVSYAVKSCLVFSGLILAGNPAKGETPANVAPEAETDSIAFANYEEELQEVVVTGQSARQRIADIRLGAEHLELSKLAVVPALFGENDIIKSITLMPGVHGEGEGAGGFEVRGGTSSQNLVLLDGLTLYNPSHVMGIFSTFNDDALGRATLYKGPIPATYGGATSSVLDTSLAPGDMESYHASATIGLLAAKLAAEGPIVKDKLSFAVTARRSYVDLFLKMIPEYSHTVMNFYDVTAKLRYQPRRGDYIDVSFMVSHDNMGISDLMQMNWGNLGASVNWLAARGDAWRFATTASFTNYTSDMSMSVMRTDQTLNEYIRSFSINEKAICALSEDQSLELGARSELLRVKSGEFDVNVVHEKEIRSGWQNSLWASYDATFNERFSVSAGIRGMAFSAMSGSRFHSFASMLGLQPDFSAKTYLSVEPRVSLKYDLSQYHNVKAGISKTSQNLHAVRANTTSFPFDRYAVTSASIKPEESWQYGIGYTGMTPDGAYDWSVEGYWKSLGNVYDFRDGRTMFSSVDLESLVLGGKGRSYGIELMARKNSGRLTGWISYALSHTQSKIPGINDGDWYDASNDRRHDISVVAIFRLTDKWNLSGSWTFSSGQPITAPDVKFELDGQTCYYYSSRNGYRTPSSHRLDLSATYTRRGRRFTTQWAFGVYNAYCHYSPFVVYFEDDSTKPSGTRAVQQSLYGLVPSVSYTLKF